MKQTLLASAALALVAAAPAHAAGMQPGDAPLWSGFYVGVEAGYAHSGFDLDGSSDSDGGHNDDSALGGVYVGHDWQRGNFVFGAVADFDAVNLHSDFGSFDPFFTIPGGPVVGKGENYSYDVDWLATARARAGYAHNDTLFYGTGGVAFANIDTSAESFSFFSPPTSGSSSDVEVGGTLGAGIEHMFSPHVSGKIEYLHYFFDDVSPDGGPDVSFKPSFDTVKVGIAYRF